MRTALAILALVALVAAAPIRVLWIGQSNARGFGTGTGVVTVTDNKIRIYSPKAGALANMTTDTLSKYDKFGDADSGAASKHSAIVSLCNNIFSYTADTVILIPCTKSTTGLVLNSAAYSYFSNRGAGSLFNLARTRVTASGGLDYIVWLQGEAEATGEFADTALYKRVLLKFYGDIKDSTGYTSAKLLTVGLGRTATTATSDAWFAMRLCLQHMDNGSTVRFVSVANDLPRAAADSLHHSAPGLDSIGQRVANAIRTIAGLSAKTFAGPQYDSLLWNSTRDTLRIAVKNCDSIRTIATGATGWKFYAGRTAKAAADVWSSGKTVSAAFASAWTTGDTAVTLVDYQSDPSRAEAVLVKGGDSLSLPLEPFRANKTSINVKKLYFGVCPGGPSDFKTGTPTVTFSSDTATFSTAQTSYLMGVGARIAYGARSAFVTKKVSTSKWLTKTKTGASPPDTATATVVSIKHPFTSINDAIAKADDSLGTSRLDSAGIWLCIPAYMERATYTKDATTGHQLWGVPGFQNTPETPIETYSPWDTINECNAIHANLGSAWTDTCYVASVNGTTEIYGAATTPHYVRFHHLQVLDSIKATAHAIFYSAAYYRQVWDVYNNHIKIVKPSAKVPLHVINAGNHSTIYFYNNIVVNAGANAADTIAEDIAICPSGHVHMYNNTFYRFYRLTAATTTMVTAYNNAFLRCVDTAVGYVGKDWNVTHVAEWNPNGKTTTQTMAQLVRDTTNADPARWDFRPNAGSNLVAAGLDLAYNSPTVRGAFGKDTGYRPVGVAWTVGAFDARVVSLAATSVSPAVGVAASEQSIKIAASNSGFVGTAVCSLYNADNRYALTVVSNTVDTAYCTRPAVAAGWYTVKATNGDLQTATDDSAFYAGTVPNISYAASPLSLTQLVAMTPATVTNSGGAADSFTISGTALPTGLSINKTNGTISGTPSATQAATDYSIVAWSVVGNDTATVSIAVVAGGGSAVVRSWRRDFDSWRSATFNRADYQYGTHSRRPYR